MQRVLSRAEQIYAIMTQRESIYRGKMFDFYKQRNESGCVIQMQLQCEYRLMMSNCATYVEHLFAMFGLNCSSKIMAAQTPNCEAISFKSEPGLQDKVIKLLLKEDDLKQQTEQFQHKMRELNETRKQEETDIADPEHYEKFCSYMRLNTPKSIMDKLNSGTPFDVYVIELGGLRTKVWHTCWLIVFENGEFASVGGWPLKALTEWKSLKASITGDVVAQKASLMTAMMGLGMTIGSAAYLSFMAEEDENTLATVGTTVGALAGTAVAAAGGALASFISSAKPSPFCVCMWDPVLELFRRRRETGINPSNMKVNHHLNQDSTCILSDIVKIAAIASPFLGETVSTLIQRKISTPEKTMMLREYLIAHMQDLSTLDNVQRQADSVYELCRVDVKHSPAS
jgi:hypothetical protein